MCCFEHKKHFYMYVNDFTFQFVQMNNTNTDLLTMLSLYNDFITNKYANRPTLWLVNTFWKFIMTIYCLLFVVVVAVVTFWLNRNTGTCKHVKFGQFFGVCSGLARLSLLASFWFHDNLNGFCKIFLNLILCFWSNMTARIKCFSVFS